MYSNRCFENNKDPMADDNFYCGSITLMVAAYIWTRKRGQYVMEKIQTYKKWKSSEPAEATEPWLSQARNIKHCLTEIGSIFQYLKLSNAFHDTREPTSADCYRPQSAIQMKFSTQEIKIDFGIWVVSNMI